MPVRGTRDTKCQAGPATHRRDQRIKRHADPFRGHAVSRYLNDRSQKRAHSNQSGGRQAHHLDRDKSERRVIAEWTQNGAWTAFLHVPKYPNVAHWYLWTVFSSLPSPFHAWNRNLHWMQSLSGDTGCYRTVTLASDFILVRL